MAAFCINRNAKEFEQAKKAFKKSLKAGKINIDDLDDVAFEQALSNCIELGHLTRDFTENDVMMKRDAIRKVIEDQRNIVRERKLKLNEITENISKVGNLEITTNEKISYNNPNTLFVFTDNLQAHNETNTPIEAEGLITPKGGVKTDVENTSARFRMFQGMVNPDAIGIVVKKNAQNKDGVWIGRNATTEDAKSSVFTEDELELFRQINEPIIKKIGELSTQEDGEYKKIWLPKRMAMDNAGLPESLARELQRMLAEIGIESQVLKIVEPKSAFKGLYGLELQTGSASNNKKSTGATEKARQAVENLSKERPIDITVTSQQQAINELHHYFPNIAERNARVTLMSTLFSRQIGIELLRYIQMLESKEVLTRQESETLNILKNGKEEDKRKELLKQRTEQGIPITYKILSDIETFFASIGALTDDKFQTPAENIKFIIENVIKNPNNIFGENYAIESQTADVADTLLERRANNIIKFCAQVSKNQRLFEGLVSAASDEIRRTENIKLSLDKSTVIDTADTIDEMEQEETPENRSGFYLIKQKMINPHDIVSTRIRKLLSSCYKVDTVLYTPEGERVTVYKYNDLGLRIPINEGVVYYNFQKRFAKMKNSFDFLPMLAQIEQEYPYAAEIIEQIRQDSDLMNEVYRNFRKIAMRYSVITNDGLIAFKNDKMDAEALLELVSKNYEGCIPLSDTSLYDEEGSINISNKIKFSKLIHSERLKRNGIKPGQTVEDVMAEKYPLYYAKDVLNPSSKGQKKATYERLKRAHMILNEGALRHDSKNNEYLDTDTLLDNILRSLGIDTTDIDLTPILPPIDWEQLDALYYSGPEGMEAAMESLNTMWSVENRKKVYNILKALEQIVNKDSGIKIEGDLVNDFKNQYLTISNSLSGLTENYTQASFFLNGNSRYSYISPDHISVVIDTIADVSNDEAVEAGTTFIENNYLQYTFYEDMPLLNEMKNDLDVREKLKRHQSLLIGTVEPGKSTDFKLLRGIIGAFTSGITKKSKRDGTIKEFGYFRNPLYSDTDALEFFMLPKFTLGDDWKESILYRLLPVLKSEITRIMDQRKAGDSEIKVDNYNTGKKNAGKFVLFSYLEKGDGLKEEDKTILEGRIPGKEEILEEYNALLQNEDLGIASDTADRYLLQVLENMMQHKFNRFKEDLSPKDKMQLYDTITKAKVNEKKELEIDDYNDELNEETNGGEEVNIEIEEDKVKYVDAFLEKFYYNDYYSQSQLVVLFGGDPAYYKDIRDFIKRNKQSYASGEKVYAVDENNQPMMERVLYLEDKMAASTTFQSIKQLFDKTDLTEMEKTVMLSALLNIDTTDGQGFRSLKSFKKIFKAMGGMWTDDIDDAFNKIQQGKPDMQSWVNLINAIKPFMFTHEGRLINGRNEKVLTQHKNSEYLISTLMTALNSALNNSPELEALQLYMELHDVDAVQFRSCVKIGCFNPLNLNYCTPLYENEHKEKYKDWRENQTAKLNSGEINQEEYNDSIARYGFRKGNEVGMSEVVNTIKKRFEYSKQDYIRKLKDLQEKYPRNALIQLELQTATIGEDNCIHTFPMEDWLVVQPNSDHLTDGNALVGSQSRNVIKAELSDDFVAYLTVGNSEVRLTKDEIIKHFDTLFVDKILQNFIRIENKFNNIQSVKSMLDAAMDGNPKYGEEVRKAFELNEDKTDFVVPGNTPTINNKAEDLLLSPFRNNIQKLHIKGGNVILVSNFGLSHGFNDELHVQYKNVIDKDGNVVKTVDYIPAYMPADMKEKYQDWLIEKKDKKGNVYWTIDFERIQREQPDAEELFKMIGYRIPTESKFSMMPIKIIGFLPIQAGAMIMLPSDIVAMSGTDFDIDKLFLMMKDARREICPPNLGLRFLDWVEKNKGEEALAEVKKNTDFMKRLTFITFNENNEPIKFGKKNQEFTKEEMRSLVHDSALFEEFVEDDDEKTGGSIYYVDRDGNLKPKYITYKPKIRKKKDGTIDWDAMYEMKGSTDAVKSATRDNMIVDAYWSILTSPEGSQRMMKGATYIKPKVSSRRAMIMNDEIAFKAFCEKYKKEIDRYGNPYEVLDNIAIIEGKENTDENILDILEKFLEENAYPDDVNDIKFYIESRRNLMDGNDLIGGFAVNSSRHQKLQLCRDDEKKALTKLDTPLKFYIPKAVGADKDGIVTIDEIDAMVSKVTGKHIGDLMEQMQTASPDNGKDPVLGYMGVSMNTLKETCLLLALGLDTDTIALLLNCKDIYDEGRAYSTKNKKVLSKFQLEKFVCDVTKLSELKQKLLFSELTDDEGNPLAELKEDDYAYMAQFTRFWDYILEAGRDLNQSSVFVRADSPNGALPTNIVDAVQQKLKIESLLYEIEKGVPTKRGNRKFHIKNLEKLIDLNMDIQGKDVKEIRQMFLDSPLPMLQAFYTCGIKNAVNQVEQYIPALSKGMMDALKKLSFATQTDLKSKRSATRIRNFLNSITTYMLSSYPYFSQAVKEGQGDTLMEARNWYIQAFPMHFNKFLNEKDDKGNFLHKKERNLSIIKMLSNLPFKGIRFHNVGGKVSIDSRKRFTEGLDQMIYSEDPAVRKFVIDLFNYEFFMNGLNFGHSNFGIFYSVDFLLNLPDFIKTLTEGNQKILNSENNEDYINNYIYQYMMNNASMIPEVGIEQGNIGKNNEYLEFSLGDKKIMGRNTVSDKNEYLPFIKVYIKEKQEDGKTKSVPKYYKYEGKQDVKIIYTEITPNTSGVPYYDSTRDVTAIDYAKLEKKGNVVSTSIQEKVKDGGKKESKEGVPVEPGISGIPKEEGTSKGFPEQNTDPSDVTDGEVMKEQEEIPDNELKIPFIWETPSITLNAPPIETTNTADLTEFEDRKDNKICRK